MDPQVVLGIETSCDETAVGIVTRGHQILANLVPSQIHHHQPYGGVVPELAARSHLETLSSLVSEALSAARLSLHDLDGIAATGGPGLIGGLIIGATFAKTLAWSIHKPFIAVNHLEAHGLTARLTHKISFPYVLLLISGGHCQFLLAEALGVYHLLGTTRDDAVGETFDKVARMLGLPYPGGPAIEDKAKAGNPNRFTLPMPLASEKTCDFSFSGLKAAVRRVIEGLPQPLSDEAICDISASFQRTVGAIFKSRVGYALTNATAKIPQARHLVAAGGVASNQALRAILEAEAAKAGWEAIFPPGPLCTDNGVMVAWAGLEYLRLRKTTGSDFSPVPRWPLWETSK
ncbi:MAG: tRNA (adenosine(37)-N6)-threonylcarbamoyltransferase complex transferase subunit TsaD [Alphaproteobacteria bacterium]